MKRKKWYVFLLLTFFATSFWLSSHLSEAQSETSLPSTNSTAVTPSPTPLISSAVGVEEPPTLFDNNIEKASGEQQVPGRAPLDFRNSATDPEIDFDTIIAQVRELADKYENAMLGKAGWLYRVSDYYFPVEYLSNTGMIEGTPVAEIRPDDLVRKEEWFLVAEDGTYTISVAHDLDQQGVVRRRWAQTNGKAVFLNLPPTSEYRVQDWPPGHVLLHEHPLWYLGVAQANNQTVRAWREGDTYTVVVTVVEEKPVELGNVGITAVSIEKRWIFDMTTGALRSTKDSLQADDGTWVPGESWVILSQEMVAQPFPEALDTLSQAERVVQEAR